MKGCIGWNLRILGVDRNPLEFYLLSLSRGIDVELCQIYTKIYIYKIMHKNSRFKYIICNKCNQSENNDIPEEHENLKFLSFTVHQLSFFRFSPLKENNKECLIE